MKEKYFIIFNAQYDGGGIWMVTDTLAEAKKEVEDRKRIDMVCIIKGEIVEDYIGIEDAKE